MNLAKKPHLLLILAVLFWSGNFIVGRAVHDHAPPVALAFWRWTAAFLLVCLPALPHLRRDWPALRGHWGILLLLAALGIGSFNTLVYIGLQWTAAINALLLQSLMPALIVAMSRLLFRERVTTRQLVGIALSLAGVMVIITRGNPAILRTLAFNRGDLLVLLAVLGYAGYSVLLRKRPPIHPLSFIALTFLLGALLLMPVYLAEIAAGRTLTATLPTGLAIAYVAIFPSIVAYLCYNRGVELIGANRAGPFIHLMPVFGSLLAIAFLGETLQWFHLPGVVLIAGGITLATRQIHR